MAPAQDPRRTQLLVFAARRLWGWDGHAWVVRSGSLPLEDRTGVALAGDAARGTVVAVGGVSPETQQPGGDTWTWNGRDWTYRSGVLPMVAPVSSAEAGADCRLDAAPDQDARPDGHGTLSLRIRFDWSRVDGVPIGCARSLSVSIRLVDAGTQRGLPIQDNNRAIKPRGGVVTLTWTNWCPGPNQVAALSASARGGTLFWPVVAPPPCLDRSRPSMLSISPGP